LWERKDSMLLIRIESGTFGWKS